MMEQGGPGGSTIDIFPGLLISKPSIAPLLDTRDIIFVEQRGTTHSKPFLSLPEEARPRVGRSRRQSLRRHFSYMNAIC